MIEFKEREHYIEVDITKDGLKIGRAEIGDDHGKTLSIDDGRTQFTINFGEIEKYLK